ncbi:hypothetical protein [Paenibacillus borealis]|uniref:Uncharacterized protein n=1 Tax=Paenibacillus borealis TaxID=160799 RepID=A0A089MYX3_PAEBO|nr:hypothetical protein [Paenibacillus borealis]AIQ61619.1 hypothetical protein PBOR_35500 [Paenibacillus borealis]
MKYKNFPAKPHAGREMLPFVQQYWIWADMPGELLYYVQKKRTGNSLSAHLIRYYSAIYLMIT